MLEDKDYSAVVMVLPFIAAFIDWATAYLDVLKITAIHTMDSNLVNFSKFKLCSVIGLRMSKNNVKIHLKFQSGHK